LGQGTGRIYSSGQQERARKIELALMNSTARARGVAVELPTQKHGHRTIVCGAALQFCRVAQQQHPNHEEHAVVSQSVSNDPHQDEETKGDGDGKTTRRGSFIIAPLPISSPALGTGIVPILGYIFTVRQKHTVSPASVVGVAGLVTNNRESWLCCVC